MAVEAIIPKICLVLYARVVASDNARNFEVMNAKCQICRPSPSSTQPLFMYRYILHTYFRICCTYIGLFGGWLEAAGEPDGEHVTESRVLLIAESSGVNSKIHISTSCRTRQLIIVTPK